MGNGRRYSRDREALEARGIPAEDGRLQANAVGEIELGGKVLVVRRIHVTYRLAADEPHEPRCDGTGCET